MKKIELLKLGLPLFALTAVAAACSDDDNNTKPVDERVISFTAVAERPPRMAGTTTATLDRFNLYAFTDGKPYRENLLVKKTGGSWSYTPAMYWPATPVNFFAYSPDISQTATTRPDGSGVIDDFSNRGDVDLLYAVTMNQTMKPSPVTLNFRHALSRVTVMLASNNPNIRVEVAHVALNNVFLKGDFEFPKATTAIDNDVRGVWSDQSQPASPLLFYAHGPSDDLVLKSRPVDVADGTLGIYFMIPQKLTDVSVSGNRYRGNYITVDCKIYDSASGVLLWPNSSTPSYQLVPESDCGRLVYPLTTPAVKAWEQGTAYVYNITIDNPAELDDIDFNITVDEYK